ncbi:uncharacterized protein LOC106642631 isoform X1 [Copidosoma floridanum]|uniref:uncharacterized protein LOC106642631 isoform X1 n=1 Tax=Copidosoma floridanum TaxID=29053 RepID=UPI0006C9D742|nr:uncharacterized protein LOC106642631 isoform X1 [Copidosoma floridanum]XP_023246963.1 uncharacterized protein LOC106642631 isoform X1 [Copidosoma floridanum]
MPFKKVGKVFKSGMYSVARTTVGQKLLSMGDKVLTILDECLQWSLPLPEKTEEKNGEPCGKTELKRPLPWIIFLPTLVVLRITRLALNFSVYILSMEPYEPAHMLLMIRSAQRRLNESRCRALKEPRSQKGSPEKNRRQLLREATKSLAKSLRLTLSTLSCLDSELKKSPSPPPIQIRVSSMFDDQLKLSSGKCILDTNTAVGTGNSSKKQKTEVTEINLSSEGDNLEEDEKFEDKLQRYANESSEDDPDFVLQNSDSQTNDEEDESSDSGDSITEAEIADIKNDQADMEDHYGVWERVGRHSLKKKLDDEVHYDVDVEGLLTDIALRNYEMKTRQQGNNLMPVIETEVPETQADKVAPPTNGTGKDGEAAYYSPASWKSVSPEISMPSRNLAYNFEHEAKTEDLNNDSIVSKTVDKADGDPTISTVDEASGEISNGHLKNKRQTTSHSSKHHHHQHRHKNKRDSHSGRKRK